MKKTDIGIYGLAGSYTEQAARKILKDKKVSLQNIHFVELPEATDLMDFMKKGNLVVFPIENSTGGTVTQLVDLFPKYDFKILTEYFMPIDHCLLAKKGTHFSDIEKVYSHAQSLLQCSEFIHAHKFAPMTDTDNSVAAKNILDMDNNVASIGGEILADVYGLKILKKKIQNSKENTTRFLVVKNSKTQLAIEKKIQNKKPQTTTIIFEAKNIAGALYKCLGSFATQGVSLSKIQSRPAHNQKNFNYFFLVEFEGVLNKKNVQSALHELEFFTEEIKIFGSY